MHHEQTKDIALTTEYLYMVLIYRQSCGGYVRENLLESFARKECLAESNLQNSSEFYAFIDLLNTECTFSSFTA